MKAKILVTVGALMIGTSAVAGNYGEWFEKVDANADGYLSAAELGEEKAHKIEKLDTDGDGLISREEYMAYKAAKKHKGRDTTG